MLADAKGLATTWVVRQLAGGQGECTLTTGDGWYFIQPHPLANNRLLIIFTMHDNDLFVDVAVYLFLYKRNRTIQEELLPASPIMIKERIIYIISSNFYSYFILLKCTFFFQSYNHNINTLCQYIKVNNTYQYFRNHQGRWITGWMED